RWRCAGAPLLGRTTVPPIRSLASSKPSREEHDSTSYRHRNGAMKLAHDAAAELLLECVDSQQFVVVPPVVPTAKVEERDLGCLITEKVVPMEVAIRTSDQVPNRRRAVLPEQGGRV